MRFFVLVKQGQKSLLFKDTVCRCTDFIPVLVTATDSAGSSHSPECFCSVWEHNLPQLRVCHYLRTKTSFSFQSCLCPVHTHSAEQKALSNRWGKFMALTTHFQAGSGLNAKLTDVTSNQSFSLKTALAARLCFLLFLLCSLFLFQLNSDFRGWCLR